MIHMNINKIINNYVNIFNIIIQLNIKEKNNIIEL